MTNQKWKSGQRYRRKKVAKAFDKICEEFNTTRREGLAAVRRNTKEEMRDVDGILINYFKHH